MTFDWVFRKLLFFFFFLHFIFFYHNEYDLVRMMSSKNSSLAITWPSSSQFYSGSTFVYSFFALALVNHYIFFSLAIFVKIDTLGCNARLSFVQREHHSIQTFTQPLTSPSPTEIGYIVVSHIEIYTFFVYAPLFAFLPLFVKLFLHLSFSFRPFFCCCRCCVQREQNWRSTA